MKRFSKILSLLLVFAMIVPGIAQAANLESAESIERIAGPNRWGTAVEVSSKLPKGERVIIANGTDAKYADALAGSALNAPILLTKTNELPEATKTQLKALAPAEVILLGGETAISKEVEAELAKEYKVERLFGQGRTGTAIEIAKKVKAPKSAIIAYGFDHADALSAGPLAIAKNMPILLTNRAGNVTPETITFLKEAGIEKIYIVGGDTRISNAVEEELKENFAKVIRLAGSNRYGTSVKIAEELGGIKSVIFANAQVPADALATGPLAAHLNAPIILVRNDEVPNLSAQTEFIKANSDKDLYIVGGEAAVGTPVVLAIEKVVEEATEEEKSKVVSVSAINETTVVVEFAEALEEDFELEGKEINVGEMVATYVDGTYDAEAKTAQFKLAGEDKLVDAQEYVVTSDWTTEETFVARVADEYVASVEITTTGVPAIEDAKVYFEATNQYGEALELTKGNTANLGAKVRVNGVPLLVNEVEYVDGNDFVTINKVLKVDDTLAVQITNEINEEDVVVGEKTFTVVKNETAVPTTIGNLKATDDEDKEVTSLAAGDVVTLTVEVLDQYGNPYAAVEDEKYVRWVAEVGEDLVKDAVFTDGNDEFTFTAKEAGTIKIVAYLANGQNVAYEAVIGAAKLTELKYVEDTLVTSGNNNEEEIIAQVEANPGAALTPEMIKFEVKAIDKDTTADDIEVRAALRKDVEEKPEKGTEDEIVIVAKTSKVGKYEITPFVGLAIDDEDAEAAPKTTFETTVNQKVANIKLGEFKANSLTLEGTTKVEVEFTNEHGEVINIPESVNAITNESIVKLPEEEAFVTETDENDVETTYVVLEAKAKGTTSFKLNSGAVESNAIQVTVVDKAKLTTVELGARITEGVIAGDVVDFLRVVEIKDQYGNDYIPEEISELKAPEVTWTGTEGNVPTATFKYYKLDANDEVEAQNTKDDDTKGVVLAINAKGSENTINRVATITVKDVDDKVLDTLAVTIQPVRKLTSVTLVPAEATLSEGATTTIVVETKDQYGDFKAEDSLKADSNNTDVVASVASISESHEVSEKQVGYKFDVEALKAGTAVLTVGTEDVNAKVTVTVEKAEAGIIDEIRLESDNLDEDGNYKFLVENNGGTAEFTVKTLKDGKVVTLDSNPTATTNDENVTATVDSGKLTVSVGGVAFDEGKTEKTVTVTLRQLGVTESIDLVISGTEAKLDLTTVKAYVEDVEIDLAEAVEVKKTQDIKFYGVDQYGKKTNLNTEVKDVENLNSSVATGTFSDGILSVTGVSKGNATINLLDKNLKTLFTVKVNVTEAAQ